MIDQLNFLIFFFIASDADLEFSMFYTPRDRRLGVAASHTICNLCSALAVPVIRLLIAPV